MMLRLRKLSQVLIINVHKIKKITHWNQTDSKNYFKEVKD